MTLKKLQSKPSFGELQKYINETTSPIGHEAPNNRGSQNSRSNSLLAKCSIGKLDAPEATLIGQEAPIIRGSQNSRSSSLLAKCSISKLDAPEATLIGQESPIIGSSQNSCSSYERKPSATIRKLTMRPFQPKPDFDQLLREYQETAPETFNTRS